LQLSSRKMYRVHVTLNHIFPPSQFAQELKDTANAIATRGKGILAADESTGTIGKRFEKISLPNTEPNRRDYRELLFRSPGWGQYISGVILYEETLNQKAADGTPFIDIIKAAGVIPGIKVDKGTAFLPGTDDETMTVGIEGLGQRCEEYYKKGCRFSKWRAVLKISQNTPSDVAIAENARGLALYAAVCQQNGLVPIIEPEVLMDGDHSIEVSASVTQAVWEATIKALHDQHVLFEGILLKPSMVTPGAEFKGPKATADEIAQATIRVLQRTIPPAIPGITFLSGGQGEEEATRNLDAMNRLALKTRVPWVLTFSYGRALQASTISAWAGDKAKVEKAQQVFISRAKSNSLAQLGKFTSEGKGEESLYEKDYKY
jgi:fructose-bisphosphate aldolase class I